VKAFRLWPWLAAIVSGLLCTACFPPFNQNWLCWIALSPLISAIWFSGQDSRRPWLRNILLGYVAGVIFFTAAFGWLGALGDLYQNWFLHGLSLLLSVYLAVHFAFWAWFAGLIRPKDFISSRRNLQTALFGGCAWVTHEWVRGWLFTGFGWNGLGVALHANWPLIQVAEFTGVAGLSFAIAFSNLIAVTIPLRLFAEARTHRMRPHFDVTLTMIGLVGLFAFGLRAVQNPSAASALRVAAVQANIPQLQKFNPQFNNQTFSRLERLSEIALRANPGPDLLIWPESSVPDPARDENSESHLFISNFSAANKADLLLGSLDIEGTHDYNAALLVSDSGQKVQVYRKFHLVPFGEYIPLRHSFPLFVAIASTWVPGDFEAGKDYTVFRLTRGDVRVAPLICFEDTIGELARHFVLNGANLLVNVTNDGWFQHSAGSRQHLANAVFRCVENRRPMARAANTGVTCFVNEFGRVTQILQDDTGSTFAEGVLTGEIDVPRNRQPTFYTRHGELFAEICAGMTAIGVAIARVMRRTMEGRAASRPK
jgi:apolipoprotein N-acyltransferase